MYERLGPGSPEISSEQMNAFVEKVRKVAPYRNQAIDSLGSYVTNFARHDGYVSLYQPAPEAADNNELDEAIRVVVRQENETDSGYTIVKNLSYVVQLDINEARYSEKIKVYDTETGRPINPARQHDIESIIELHDENQRLTSNKFDQDRLREVNQILDDLSPEDII